MYPHFISLLAEVKTVASQYFILPTFINLLNKSMSSQEIKERSNPPIFSKALFLTAIFIPATAGLPIKCVNLT